MHPVSQFHRLIGIVISNGSSSSIIIIIMVPPLPPPPPLMWLQGRQKQQVCKVPYILLSLASQHFPLTPSFVKQSYTVWLAQISKYFQWRWHDSRLQLCEEDWFLTSIIDLEWGASSISIGGGISSIPGPGWGWVFSDLQRGCLSARELKNSWMKERIGMMLKRVLDWGGPEYEAQRKGQWTALLAVGSFLAWQTNSSMNEYLLGKAPGRNVLRQGSLFCKPSADDTHFQEAIMGRIHHVAIEEGD